MSYIKILTSFLRFLLKLDLICWEMFSEAKWREYQEKKIRFKNDFCKFFHLSWSYEWWFYCEEKENFGLYFKIWLP